MENYKKGKCVQETLNRDKIGISNIPQDILWMQVNAGSKVKALLSHALGVIADGDLRCVLWTGTGAGVSRAISCAEMMKRECKMSHQITKIGYRKCEEFWKPQTDGLERLVVNREVPIIHIYLSADPLNTEEKGYQSVNSTNLFWQTNSKDKKKFDKSKRPKVSPEEITVMGLQSQAGKKKGNRNSFKSNIKETQQHKPATT